MKITFFSFFLLAANLVFAQLPETDIFISRISKEGGKMVFSTPENITRRKGYDNQPFFMPDGKSLLYVAVPDTTQADIFRYDFASGKISAVTSTEESEYSPMLTPDGKNISWRSKALRLRKTVQASVTSSLKKRGCFTGRLRATFLSEEDLIPSGSFLLKQEQMS